MEEPITEQSADQPGEDHMHPMPEVPVTSHEDIAQPPEATITEEIKSVTLSKSKKYLGIGMLVILVFTLVLALILGGVQYFISHRSSVQEMSDAISVSSDFST